MENSASFGYWLRRRRKALDLTQEALARCVGCAVVTISKFERDELRPSRQIAERLAECLGIALDERAAFVKAARAELAPNRLPPATIPPKSIPEAAPPVVLAANTPRDVGLHALPTGTVTFLFTDIEGSTRLWEQYPKAMQVAVARHDMLLRHAISTHEGAIV